MTCLGLDTGAVKFPNPLLGNDPCSTVCAARVTPIV
jgi:hypothetical protein